MTYQISFASENIFEYTCYQLINNLVETSAEKWIFSWQ